MLPDKSPALRSAAAVQTPFAMLLGTAGDVWGDSKGRVSATGVAPGPAALCSRFLRASFSNILGRLAAPGAPLALLLPPGLASSEPFSRISRANLPAWRVFDVVQCCDAQ